MFQSSSASNENLFADDIVAVVGPTYNCIVSRQKIFSAIENCIKSIFSSYPALSFSVYMYGSVPLRTFLLDSDIDISVVISDSNGLIKPTLSRQIYTDLIEKLKELEKANVGISGIHSIPAEVNVIKLQWDSVPIDITFQQYSAYIAYNYLDQMNQLMGRAGLFKRGIILVKAWCLYDSHILGSQHGNLCSYAIEIMILYIMNNYYDRCLTPLDILKMFIRIFSKFDWADNILTIFGVIPIAQYNKAIENVLF